MEASRFQEEIKLLQKEMIGFMAFTKTLFYHPWSNNRSNCRFY